MKPQIDTVWFGMIKVSGKTIKHDIVIGLDGNVEKRRSELSKNLYGTSHIVSQEEIESIWTSAAETLIVGTGFFNRVRLSSDAQTYLTHRKCAIELRPIKHAIHFWNERQGKIIGLFHITC